MTDLQRLKRVSRILLTTVGLSPCQFCNFSKCALYNGAAFDSSKLALMSVPVDHSSMQCSTCTEVVRMKHKVNGAFKYYHS